MDFVTNAISPAIRFLTRLAQVGIGLFAGGMLVAGQLTVGVFQAFFQYVTQATEPLTQLSLTVNQLQGALAAAERVFRLLDEPEVEPTRLSPASRRACARPCGLRARALWLRHGAPAHA